MLREQEIVVPTPVTRPTVSLALIVAAALATVLYARVLTVAVGVPGIFNFFHFFGIFLLVITVSFKYGNDASQRLNYLLCLFFGVIIVSALLSGAGFVNAMLDFLLMAEPFFILVLVVCTPWSARNIKTFRWILYIFVCTHLAMAYFQYIVFGLSGDPLKGLFLNQGAGHHVGGALALTAGTYFFMDSPLRQMWIKVVFSLACLGIGVFTDSKQMVAIFILTVGLMSPYVVKSVKKLALYGVALIIGAMVYFLLATFLLDGLRLWEAGRQSPTDISNWEQGFSQKFSVFPIAVRHYDNGLNWLFGLGPGHSVSRVSQMIPQYENLLGPLGATTSEASLAISRQKESVWISASGPGSSVWSNHFTWAGVWGDLGLVGLAIYVLLWMTVWRFICLDVVGKYLVAVTVFLGVTFSWPEEPGFILFLAAVIGLRYQEICWMRANRAVRSPSPEPEPAPAPA